MPCMWAQASPDTGLVGDWDGESYTCEYCARNDNQSDSESISVYDATQIWLSNGKDEDYTFGYSEEELENALS